MPSSGLLPIRGPWRAGTASSERELSSALTRPSKHEQGPAAAEWTPHPESQHGRSRRGTSGYLGLTSDPLSLTTPGDTSCLQPEAPQATASFPVTTPSAILAIADTASETSSSSTSASESRPSSAVCACLRFREALHLMIDGQKKRVE